MRSRTTFRTFLIVGAFLLILFTPFSVEALLQADIDISRQTEAFAGSGGAGFADAEDPRVIVANVIRFALGFLGILLTTYMIYAGYLWMTSAGNTDQVDKAKKIIRNAIIALIITLSGYTITNFVIDGLRSATRPKSTDPFNFDFTTESSRDYVPPVRRDTYNP